MADITFTAGDIPSPHTMARAIGDCYRDFEARMAGLAAAQGVPWPEPPPDETPTAESFADTCRVQDIDLARSVLARHGTRGPIVGIALLGRRGDRGWLGDFAVAPEHRGRGLGHRLMAAFLDSGRAAGVRQLEFDVLAVNTPALRVYEAAGCRSDQRMDRFVAAGGGLRPADAAAAGLTVAPLSRDRIAAWFNETMSGQPPPCWERDLPSLLAYRDAGALVARDAGGERAALVYALDRAPPGGRPRRLNVMLAGFRPGAGAPHLRSLLTAGSRGGEGIEMTAGLEPVDSRLADVLRELGFRPTRPAYNMRREL